MKGDRQRLIFVPSPEHVRFGTWFGVRTVAVFVLFWMYPGVVKAAMWPNLLFQPLGSSGVHVGLEHDVELVPPFRAAPRDRSHAFVQAHWRPSDSVFLDTSWSWLQDSMPSGEKVSGPGDLRLGTHATVWQGPISLGLGWRVKLPNAADEGGLGTDETDVTALGTISKGLGNAIVMAAGGVHVQGDPIRFANQDDVGLTWVGVASEIGAVQWFSQVGGTLRSSRNPARLSTELGVSYGCPLAVGGGVRKGLTPAAETWGGNLWVGFGAGCD